LAVDRESSDTGQPAAVLSDRADARVAARRRQLMLGAAAVLPSVITLPSGAQTAVASSKRCFIGPNTDAPIRFVQMPDGWLRKQIHSGTLQGRPAYCTTWDQDYVVQAPIPGKSQTATALPGTTWSVDGWNITAGETSFIVDNVSLTKDYYALVYTDETFSMYVLDVGTDTQGRLHPIRELCWTSMIGSQGVSLG
jgi:hypothetical protein